MTRWGTIGPALLLAGLMVTAGCVGPIGVTEGDVSPEPEPEQQVRDPEPSLVEKAEGSDTVRLSLHLALTEDSRIPLDIQTVRISPVPSGALAFQTVAGRLIPGEDARIGIATLLEGTEVPEMTVEVSFFDGLGRANFTAVIDGFRATTDISETIHLRDEGPGQISFVHAEGPLEVRPRTTDAIPQYGYLLFPDGSRTPVPGFGHAIHVPEGYPKLPAGEQMSFLVEAPEHQEVLWRVEGADVVRGPELTLTPEPGAHHVRLSVGPGDDETSLLVRTDYEDVVNGTLLAGTPQQDPTIEPVTGVEHHLKIDDRARHLTIVLRPLDPRHGFEDLDLYLENPNGDTQASSTTEGETLETISLSSPRPGNYTVRIDADGAAQHYSLFMRVIY